MKIYILATLGLLISGYAAYVKWRLGKEETYHPACDLHDRVSCSKAFTSEYANLLVLPNAVLGIPFYSLVLVLHYLDYITLVFSLALFATLGSVYLAYISFVKQKNYCLVCMSIYLINILLLVFS